MKTIQHQRSLSQKGLMGNITAICTVGFCLISNLFVIGIRYLKRAEEIKSALADRQSGPPGSIL